MFYVTDNNTVKQKKSYIYKQIRQVNDDKLAELSMQLGECDWSKCDVNPNVAFDSLNDKLFSLYNSVCPEKTKKSKVLRDKRKALVNSLLFNFC